MNASGNPRIVKWWKGRELPSSWWPHGVTQLDAPPTLSFGSRLKSYSHVLLELFSSDYHPGDFSAPSTSPSKVPTIDSRVIDEPLPALDTEMRILVSPLSFHSMPPKKDAGFTAKHIKGRQVHLRSSRLFHRSPTFIDAIFPWYRSRPVFRSPWIRRRVQQHVSKPQGSA